MPDSWKTQNAKNAQICIDLLQIYIHWIAMKSVLEEKG